MTTIDQINTAAEGLGERDFDGFAGRISAIDPALGRVVELHAEAADGNSPDLKDWIGATAEESAQLVEEGIHTTAAAARWWFARYLPGVEAPEESA